ncbi:MAG: LysM peptidoglycan-binding domain-containing protein [Defluviitaleaceae bacterium]|nr:LysM peptidoglycan-binding domain-containing protein [Defluviitaleaceae bacterium]
MQNKHKMQSYVLQRGDTIYRLARRFNTTISAILGLNPGLQPYNLRIGQIVYIPEPSIGQSMAQRTAIEMPSALPEEETALGINAAAAPEISGRLLPAESAEPEKTSMNAEPDMNAAEAVQGLNTMDDDTSVITDAFYDGLMGCGSAAGIPAAE